MWGLGPSHIAVIGVIAVLLFGDRLPEVMRSLGRGMVEFKKGLRGIETAIDSASTASAQRSTPSYAEVEEREEITAPRFQPPPAEPRLESTSTVAAPAAPSVAAEVSQGESKPTV
jgi:sec-independent protein translocase protein TatA